MIVLRPTSRLAPQATKYAICCKSSQTKVVRVKSSQPRKFFDPVVFPLNRHFPGSSVLPSPCPFNQSDRVRPCQIVSDTSKVPQCCPVNNRHQLLVPPPSEVTSAVERRPVTPGSICYCVVSGYARVDLPLSQLKR